MCGRTSNCFGMAIDIREEGGSFKNMYLVLQLRSDVGI